MPLYKNMNDKDVIELHCDCECKALHFWLDEEIGELFVHVKPEYYSYKHDTSFKERVKLICRILFKKKVYMDNLILDKPTVEKFIEELTIIKDRMADKEGKDIEWAH